MHSLLLSNIAVGICVYLLKKVVSDLAKQFDNIVGHIFGASIIVLIKIPADVLIQHKLVHEKSPK